MEADAPFEVDIIIVHYSDTASLKRCLQAVSGLQLQPRTIFIVDNSLELDPTGLPLNAEVLTPSHNLGFAGGVNLAATRAEGDWLALLNPDAFPEPDWLTELAGAANRAPETPLFASKQVMAEDKGLLDGAGDVYHASGLYWRRGYLKPASTAYSSEVFSACGGAMLVQKDVFTALDGLDETFFAYGEDVDFGFRVRLAGYSVRYCETAVVLHEGYTSSGGRHSDFALLNGHRNLVWVFVKNMPLPLFILLAPLHLLLNLWTVVRFVPRGKSGVILRAKGAALEGLARVLRQRRQVQSTRLASSWAIWKALTKDPRR